MKAKIKTKIIIALCAGIAVLLLGVAIGSVNIPPADVLRIVGHNMFGLALPEHITPGQNAIVWSIRFPRALVAFCAGAALSVSGAVMQSLLRNPLASSYTLGVSSGASLGASLVILVGISLPFLSVLTLPVLGFVFGLGTVLLVISITKKLDPSLESHTIILTGIVLALFINAVSTLLFVFYQENMQRMVFWQMGSFSMLGWQAVYILAPVTIIGVFFITRFKWELDVMTFGEEQSQAIGVDTRRVKLILLITASALTGSTIAFAGVIGFVDLVSPHIVRKLFGASHRHVIPMSALVGGTFMVLADLAARTVTSPVELPVGAVTAIIGAPFFAYVYFSKRKEQA